MIDVPERVTAAWLNGLDLEERIAFFKTPFWRRMQAQAAGHVTYFRWATETRFGQTMHNASVFFLDLGGNLYAVTAAHVFDGYMKAKRDARRILCHIENVEFDPERRLKARGADIDIALFDFTYEELARIRKQALVADAGSWPPPHPLSGQGVYLAGFPGAARLWTGRRSISFGLFLAYTPINSASDRSITCPFRREFWVDASGRGLPPEGYDLGGISGGPLLLPVEVEGAWSFQLGGVISEAPSAPGFQTVVAVPAHFIAANGTINERSAPVRHFVQAG